uniref:F-box/kelch-repeat protein At1g16250-like n=1 Tax=Erigeron canadensis TaxID=72917 RepID=UPI001CB9D5EE|nr:F-box/kelch-repeat protein At1g16250-like [Erigeron canadensis]
MGSLPSSSRLSRRQDEDSPQYRVYASFSAKRASPGVNISNWIECYNPLTNEWRRVTSIPGLVENHIMKGFAMVIVEDFIYVIGGLLCYKDILIEGGHDNSSDGPSEIDQEVTQSVLRYSIRDETWLKCSSLNVPRFDFACSVHGSKIYVSGGKSKPNSVRGVSSSEIYDPALDEWKLLPNMSTSRYKCVGVTWQDRIYVVGGFAEYECETNDNNHGPFSMARSSAEVFDTVNNKWDFLPRMWDLDIPPNQIVDVGGKLFSSGDCYKKWKGFIEKFDRELNMWNVVDGSSLSSPTSMLDVTSPKRPLMEQLYLTIAPIGTSLYFLAGYRMNGEETSNFRSEVHVFKTYEGVWTSFEPMLEDVEKELSCHCAVYKGRI